MNSFKGSVLLLIASVIWGFTFVAQSTGMEYLGPYTFNALRFAIGFLVLIPLVLISLKKDKKRPDYKVYLKTSIIAGVLVGIPEAAGSTFQQMGIVGTTAGKAGFITSLYIVLVPLFSRKKKAINVWLAIVLALVGFFVLCFDGEFKFNIYDLFLLLCALAFSFQILAIDKYSGQVNVYVIAMMEFLITALVSFVLMLIFKEEVTWSAIVASKIPILYSGLMACGIAYTFQIIGQQSLDPTIASLIMSLESVFSVVGGAIVLDEHLSYRELNGCALIFIAVMLSQIPGKLLKKPFVKH